MKYILFTLSALTLATSCQRHPVYMCHFVNARHTDSTATQQLTNTYVYSMDSAKTICNMIHDTRYPTDSTYVTIEYQGTPM